MGRFFPLFVAFCMCLGARAQNTAGQYAPPKQLDSAKFLIGSWAGDANVSMEGKNGKGTAHTRTALVLSGRYLQFNIAFDVADMNLMPGMMMLTYKEEDRSFHSWWFDSTNADVIHSKGKFEGGKLILMSDAIDLGNSQKFFVRTSFSRISDKLKMLVELGDGAKFETAIACELGKEDK